MSAIDRPAEPATETATAGPTAEFPSAPTPAELVRSVLAAARSLSLATDGYRVELVGLHSLEAPDRVLLTIPAADRLAEEIAATPEGELAASVEFTDVAPVAVPERVRARVRLNGLLSRVGDGGYRFTTVTAELEHAGRTVEVEPEALARAEPDPLAETEAEILTHLAAAHTDAIELLAQLVDPRLLTGVTRVDLLRLDRYGIVLRLQRVGGLRDVRLPFATPLCNPAHGVVQLRHLLTRARRCPRSRR